MIESGCIKGQGGRQVDLVHWKLQGNPASGSLQQSARADIWCLRRMQKLQSLQEPPQHAFDQSLMLTFRESQVFQVHNSGSCLDYTYSHLDRIDQNDVRMVRREPYL